MKEGLTDQERKQVVDEAIRLIELPQNFVQGAWKCPVYELPKTAHSPAKRQGLTDDQLEVIDDHYYDIDPESLKPAKDERGRLIFAYCAEGAINQAGMNVLGLERAEDLGAYDGSKKYGEPEPAHGPKFSEYLSVNEVSRVLYADFLTREVGATVSCPLEFINDWGSDDGWEVETGAKESAHEKILSIFRKRVAQLRADS